MIINRQITELDDFTAGAQAFRNEQQALYLDQSAEWQEGYREEWCEHNRYALSSDDSGHWEEEAWGQELDQITEAYVQSKTKPELEEIYHWDASAYHASIRFAAERELKRRRELRSGLPAKQILSMWEQGYGRSDDGTSWVKKF